MLSRVREKAPMVRAEEMDKCRRPQHSQSMMRLLKRMWDGLLFAAMYIGLVYLPADLFGLPKAYPWLGHATEMIDRSDLILGLAALAVGYILWMDARPFLARFGERQKAAKLGALGQECLNLSRDILSADKRANSYEHHRALIQPIFWELSEAGIPFPIYNEGESDAVNANAAAKFLAAVGGFLKYGRLEEAQYYAQERRIKNSKGKLLPRSDSDAKTSP